LRGEAPNGFVLGADETAELMAGLEKRSVEVVMAPQMLLSPFQQAHLSVLDQISYVQDYELKAVGGLEVWDPVIDTVEDGMRLGIRCVPTSDGTLVTNASLDYSVVEQPIATMEMSFGVGPSSRLTVHLPDVESVRLNGGFEVQPSGSLVMSTDRIPDADEHILVLILVTRVDGMPRGF